VILAALLIGMGAFTGLIGILADLIAVNRKLLEKLLAREATAAGREPAHPKAASRAKVA
jgi:hypothetical protein